MLEFSIGGFWGSQGVNTIVAQVESGYVRDGIPQTMFVFDIIFQIRQLLSSVKYRVVPNERKKEITDHDKMSHDS